jgi:hypothetical protein
MVGGKAKTSPYRRAQLAVFPSGGRITRSTHMTQIWALRSSLEKQPTGLPQYTCSLQLASAFAKLAPSLDVRRRIVRERVPTIEIHNAHFCLLTFPQIRSREKI